MARLTFKLDVTAAPTASDHGYELTVTLRATDNLDREVEQKKDITQHGSLDEALEYTADWVEEQIDWFRIANEQDEH